MSIGIAASNRRRSTFSPSSLFTASEVGAWYDPSDLSTLYQSGSRASPGTAVAADGDPVGLVLDKSGNSFDLVQATAGSRPLYKIDGNGHPYLLFDGVDDWMSVAFTMTQPFDRITALQQVSWTSTDTMIGHFTGGVGLRQIGTTPNLRLGLGTGGLDNNGLAIGSNGVVTEHWEGASSKLSVNNGAYVAGNSTSSSSATSLAMASAVTGATFGNMRFYGGLSRAGTLTDPQIANVRTYLGAKCGVAL